MKIKQRVADPTDRLSSTYLTSFEEGERERERERERFIFIDISNVLNE